MAGPITHIVFATKLFTSGLLDPSISNYKEFIIGTSFPDIRYLGVIDRKKTHPNVTWSSVVNEPSSFLAGLKFHALLDEIREAYLVEHNAYNTIPHYLLPQAPYAMKHTEDILLYNKIDNWDEIATFFNEIISEELQFGIAQHEIKNWHMIIKWYCSQHPNQERGLQLLRAIGPVLSTKMNYTAMLINRLTFDQHFEQLTLQFYDTFQNYLID